MAIEPACIQAANVAYDFGNGQGPVFSQVTFSLHPGITAIIGNNGSGKSLLAALLAGKKSPTEGHIRVSGTVGYLTQGLKMDDALVGDVLGYNALLAAYARIEQGQCLEADFAQLEGHWDFANQTTDVLQHFGLDQTLLKRSLHSLSGGEQTKVRLMQLALQDDDIVVLDEPSNHLDQASRSQLVQWIKQRPCVVIVTHNRRILKLADAIVELEQGKALPIQGGWETYLQTKTEQRVALEHQERKIESTLKHTQRKQQERAERHAQRLKQGRHNRKHSNQSKSLLDAAKETAQTSQSSKIKASQRSIEQYQHQLHTIKNQKARFDPLHFHTQLTTRHSGVIVQLDALYLPYSPVGPVDMQLRSGEKIAITGTNGCGKSTLLKVIAGQIAPRTGQCINRVKSLYLDQHFSLLDKTKTALENFAALCPDYTQTEYRTRLAHIRLRRDKALYPVEHLSGGERLKLMLACLFSSNTPAELLLLDEPDNHLDLESQHLLAQVIRDFPGSILLVSHDQDFIQSCGIVDAMRFSDKSSWK